MSGRKSHSRDGSNHGQQQRQQQQQRGPAPNGSGNGQTTTPERRSAPEANGSGTPVADPGMAKFEERFRTLREQTVEALREQADAFDSVMEAGVSAMRNHAAVSAELTQIKSKLQSLTDQHEKLKGAFDSSSRDLQENRAGRETAEKLVDELKASLEQTKRQLTGATNANDELRAANTAFEKDLQESASTNEKLQAALVNQKRGNEELQVAKREVEDALGQEKAAVGRMEARAEAAESANQELHAVKNELEEAKATLTEQHEAVSAKLVSVNSANNELQQIKASLEQKVVTFASKVSDLEEELESAAREHEKTKSHGEALRSRVGELEADNEALQEAAQAAEQEQSKLADTRATLETCLAELGVKAQSMSTERKAPEISRAAEKEIPALKERIAELEHELEQARESATGGGVVSEAMCRELAEQAAAAKEIVGILRHPKLDNNKRKTLVTSATDLASQLDVLNTTAELSLPDTVIQIEPEPINLIDVMQGTMESLAPTVSRKSLKLTNRIDPKVPAKIEADRGRLEQLISWATTFVTRHAVEGEVSVMVQTEPGDDGAPSVRFHLCNDGLGMDPDKLDALINPHAVEEEGALDEVGTFTCLAEAMGGELHVEPAGKEGFAVRFSIPTKRPVSGESNRRTTDRVLQELLQCDLGPVVDLSPTGMRVVCSKQPKKHVEVELGNKLQSMKVRAFVVWTNKLDRKQWEVGLRFVDLRPAQSEQLARIAKKHGLCAKA